jgi:hypothetical protein
VGSEYHDYSGRPGPSGTPTRSPDGHRGCPRQGWSRDIQDVEDDALLDRWLEGEEIARTR